MGLPAPEGGVTSAGPAIAPLIGREKELLLLIGLVDRVRAGGGAVVVRGEPGIGKSALLVATALGRRDVVLRLLGEAAGGPEQRTRMTWIRESFDDGIRDPASGARSLADLAERVGAEEVADLVLLLAGDRIANATGADFIIDGGLIGSL